MFISKARYRCYAKKQGLVNLTFCQNVTSLNSLVFTTEI